MGSAVEDQRAERRDVPKFLARHESCASDFEIRRISGRSGGRLSLVCNGCGEGAVYDAGEPGALKQIESLEVVPARARHVSREQLERWLPAPAALPWWVPNAYIVVVIAVGLALIGFGLFVRTQERGPIFVGENPQQETTVPVQAVPAPPPATGASAAGPDKGREGEGDGAQKSDNGGDRSPDLDEVIVLNRFAIGVPSGWLRGLDGGAVVFTTPGREATLRVFLEPGDERPQRLSREAAEFLEREHPSAKISPPQRFRLDGNPAVRLVASYEGGTEHAALVSESGYSYLLLSRVDKGTPRPIRTAATAAMQSFDAL